MTDNPVPLMPILKSPGSSAAAGPVSRSVLLAALIPGVGRALNNVYDEVQDPVLTWLMPSYPRVVNDVKDRVRGLRGGRAML
jgi:hypothetical protein